MILQDCVQGTLTFSPFQKPDKGHNWDLIVIAFFSITDIFNCLQVNIFQKLMMIRYLFGRMSQLLLML